MAWTTAEQDRIDAIYTMVLQLQTAVKNLAAKQQMRQLLLIRQQEVSALTTRVEELERAISLLQDAIL